MTQVSTSIKEIIIKYLDQSADPAELEKLSDWLKENQENKDSFKGLTEAWYISNAILSNNLDTEIALNNLNKKIYAPQPIKSKRVRYLFYIAIQTAACIIAVLTLFFLWKESQNTKEIITINRIIMPVDTKGPVELPDGSTVWLSSGSKITYPEKFMDKQRDVTVEGKALFHVVRNENIPFVVHADNLNITVLGTSFEVDNYPETENIETVLLSGSVIINLNTENFILKPNEKLAYSKKKGITQIEPVDAETHCIWANKKLIFDNSNLAEVLLKLEKWYDIRVQCPRGIAEKTFISFTLSEESKEQIFDMISKVTSTEYKIEGNNVYLFSGK